MTNLAEKISEAKLYIPATERVKAVERKWFRVPQSTNDVAHVPIKLLEKEHFCCDCATD